MNVKVAQLILKTRPGSFICILVLLLINAGLYVYIYAYQSPHIAGLQSSWFEKRRLAGGGVAADAATVYRQGTSDLAAWRARISPKKEFAKFIGELFATAANNTLKVGSITYKPTSVKEESLLAYTIDINVSGKYAAIKSFISDIGRLKDIAVINNISLSSAKAAEESVDLRLQLTAYFRVEG